MNGRPILRKAQTRRLTAAEKNYNKAMAELQESINRAGYILFPSLALALYEEFGWKKEHISRVLKVCQAVWIECSETVGVSMVQMCYDETGISVTNDSGKDFEELSYLSEKYWQEAKKHNHFKTRDQELIYLATVRRKQSEWMEAVITSGIFLAMHRREGFGYDRNMRLYERMRTVKLAHDNNPEELCNVCNNVLHMDLSVNNGLFFFEAKEIPENDKQAI